MSDRVWRGEAFWRQAMEWQVESGLSVAAYCRQHGLVAKTFYKWRRKFRSIESQPRADIPVFADGENRSPPVGESSLMNNIQRTAESEIHMRNDSQRLVELVVESTGLQETAGEPFMRTRESQPHRLENLIEVSLPGGVCLRLHGDVSAATVAELVHAFQFQTPLQTQRGERS